MAHYAKVVDCKVTKIIVAEADFFKTFVDSSPGQWMQTSYNTHQGTHFEGKPLRGNYAGIGYTYDAINDVFYPPKPDGDGWTISESTWTWVNNNPQLITGSDTVTV